jgi:hypothetical protein
VHALGGYRVQGRDVDTAAALRRDARELAEAGAALAVFEMVPATLATEITLENPELITIGIGAGGGTSGQVLVLHDMLGLGSGRKPRFVRNFMAEGGSIAAAIGRYVAAVKDGASRRPTSTPIESRDPRTRDAHEPSHATDPHHHRPARRARRPDADGLRADDGQSARGPSSRSCARRGGTAGRSSRASS